MPTVQRAILVNAPVATVFEFVADYRNTVKYQRQFTKFEPVGTPTRGLGLTVDARGWFKGLPVRSKLRIVEFVQNERIVSRSIAHLKSGAEWLFSAENEGTRVRFVATFEFPIPIFSGRLRRAVEQEVVAMTESALRDLKRLVEVAVATDAAGPTPSQPLAE